MALFLIGFVKRLWGVVIVFWSLVIQQFWPNVLVKSLVRLKFVFSSIYLAWIFSLSWWNHFMWGHVWTPTLGLVIKTTAHSNVLVHTDPQFCLLLLFSFWPRYWLFDFNTNLSYQLCAKRWANTHFQDLCGQAVRHICLPPFLNLGRI